MKPGNTPRFERGIFTLSLDFELIWGTVDLFGTPAFQESCLRERDLVPRLLDLFVEYDLRATWCTLGHLFLDQCSLQEGIKHPEIHRPQHSWCQSDWFAHDPCGREADHPLHYGKSLLECIQACPVPQEIGCHSFSHVIFGDKGCSRATAESELQECVRLARERNITLSSFAFPRNAVGHLDLLAKYGFTSFRGPDPCWYSGCAFPGVFKRLLHLWDVLWRVTPPVVVPEYCEEKIWNIPGSMIYFPMHGFRQWLPRRWRVQRMIKGVNAAIEKKQIFHLWFHPTNLADQPEAMFAGLRELLEYLRPLREKGQLDVLTMGEIARQLSNAA